MNLPSCPPDYYCYWTQRPADVPFDGTLLFWGVIAIVAFMTIAFVFDTYIKNKR